MRSTAKESPVRSEVPEPRNAVEPALPGHSHRPLEGVARSAAGEMFLSCVRSELPEPRDAVEPALPGHSHRPLEGVARSAAGVSHIYRRVHSFSSGSTQLACGSGSAGAVCFT